MNAPTLEQMAGPLDRADVLDALERVHLSVEDGGPLDLTALVELVDHLAATLDRVLTLAEQVEQLVKLGQQLGGQLAENPMGLLAALGPMMMGAPRG